MASGTMCGQGGTERRAEAIVVVAPVGEALSRQSLRQSDIRQAVRSVSSDAGVEARSPISVRPGRQGERGDVLIPARCRAGRTCLSYILYV